MYNKIIILGICLTLFGCGELSYRIAICSKHKMVCSNNEMFEVKVADKGSIPTSATFVILVKAEQGKLDSLSATVVDHMQNKVVIDPSDIHKPGTHNFIDSSYWLVRFDWEKYNHTIRTEGIAVWTVMLSGKQNNKTLSETRQFRINH